jgi:hypothetical protein
VIEPGDHRPIAFPPRRREIPLSSLCAALAGIFLAGALISWRWNA